MRGVATLLVLVPFFGMGAGAQSGPQHVGFITDMKGRWDIVREGQASPLPAERRTIVIEADTLRKGDEDPAAYVIVALYTGTMAKFTTTTTMSPPGRARPGPIGRVMRAIQMRFQEDFITASVRGGGNFHDAVVKAERDHSDFSAVFKGADRGAYTVTMYELDARGTATRPSRAMARVQVDQSPARGPALVPGLYQVDVSDGPGGLAGSAWIRVVPQNRYQAASTEFAQLPSADAAAGPELGNAARAIARTYLTVLDDIVPTRP